MSDRKGKRAVAPAEAAAPRGIETDIKPTEWFEAVQDLVKQYEEGTLTVDEAMSALSALADAAMLDEAVRRQRAEEGK